MQVTDKNVEKTTRFSRKPARKAISVLTAIATSFVMIPLSSTVSSAGERHWGHRYDHGHRVIRCGPRNDYCGRRHYRHHKRKSGDIAAAAAIGILGTAIIAGALSNANRPHTTYREHYYPNRKVYPTPPGRHHRVTRHGGSLEPWTPGWFNWCDARYRSFNPQTGTFRGYDGRDHFCVPR